MRFRKRPVVVEAMQWTGDNINELWGWAGADNVYGPTEGKPLRLYVAANDAWLDLPVGEWIIRDSAGYYPCKAEVFDATYDADPVGEVGLFPHKVTLAHLGEALHFLGIRVPVGDVRTITMTPQDGIMGTWSLRNERGNRYLTPDRSTITVGSASIAVVRR